MVGMPSLSTTRQVKICATTGARSGSRARRVLVRPWLALTGTGCGIRSARYPRGRADVPAVQGMLDQPFPGFLFQLEPEPFRDALLHPPDQHGGGVDALDDGGLVGGEQRDPVAGQFLLQLQRVEGVPAGPFDVLADHGGEFRGRRWRPRRAGRPCRRRGGCRRRRTARQASPRPRWSRSRPPDSMSQYQAAMNQPGGSQARADADLPAQRGAGVLHLQGRGAAQERDRDRLGRGPAAAASVMMVLLCWRCHWSTSMITSACRASISCARFPVAMRILNRTLIPPGLSPSAHIIADHAPIRRYSRRITMMIFPAFPRLFLLPFTALFPDRYAWHFRGVFPGRGRAGARAVHPVTVGHPQGCTPHGAGPGGAPHRTNDLDRRRAVCSACPGRRGRDGPLPPRPPTAAEADAGLVHPGARGPAGGTSFSCHRSGGGARSRRPVSTNHRARPTMQAGAAGWPGIRISTTGTARPR